MDSGTIKIGAEDIPSNTQTMQQSSTAPIAASKHDENRPLPLPASVQALRPDIGGTVASDPRGARTVKPRVALKDRIPGQGQKQALEGNTPNPQASSAFRGAAENREHSLCAEILANLNAKEV